MLINLPNYCPTDPMAAEIPAVMEQPMLTAAAV
jgi:hypothetical protein